MLGKCPPRGEPSRPTVVTMSTDRSVDHVVALSDAWKKGARSRDGTRRAAFANDPMNLLAVDGPVDVQLGGGVPTSGTPEQRGGTSRRLEGGKREDR